MITSKWTPPDMERLSWLLELFDDGALCAHGEIAYVKAGVADLKNVQVLPEFRKKGIGDLLVKVLIYKCSQLEISSAIVERSDESEGFLNKLGFKEPSDKAQDCSGKYQGFSKKYLVKEITDGSCENCAHKRACEEIKG